MLITTANDIPGYEITDVYGEVFGLTVRSRNAFSQLGAGLKSIMGGELKGMTKALVDSRNDVIHADDRGGRGEGCERDRRDALRHVGDGRHVDGDLRVRHRRTHHQGVSAVTRASPAGVGSCRDERIRGLRATPSFGPASTR